jgi:hypothetical protein
VCEVWSHQNRTKPDFWGDRAGAAFLADALG